MDTIEARRKLKELQWWLYGYLEMTDTRCRPITQEHGDALDYMIRVSIEWQGNESN